MPILQFGEKLSSTYLERFNPPENTPQVISVLALQSIAVEYHWLDIPSLNVKGSFACNGGACCQYFGVRNQNYHVPVFVYTNAESTEGTVMDWSLTKTLYDTLCGMASRYNLLQYDLEVVKVRQNAMGTRTSFTVVPTVCRRDYMTPEQKQSIEETVKMFFSVGESTLVQPLSEEKYLEYARFMANQPAISAPQVQPFGGMIQPPASQRQSLPAFGSVPKAPAMPHVHVSTPQIPSTVGASPAQAVKAEPTVEVPKTPPTGKLPKTAPIGQVSTPQFAGTIPQPQVSTPVNEVPGSNAREISPAEIDQLLGDMQGV